MTKEDGEDELKKKSIFGKDTMTLMGSCTFMIILGTYQIPKSF